MPYVREEVPLWVRRDIDRWMAHLCNQTMEEAEGSWDFFTCLHNGEGTGRVILEGREVDSLIIVWHVEGVTFIKSWGDADVKLYVGTSPELHDVYHPYEVVKAGEVQEFTDEQTEHLAKLGVKVTE